MRSPRSIFGPFVDAILVLVVIGMGAVSCNSDRWPTAEEEAQKSVAIVETETGWGSAVAFKVPGSDRVFFLTAKHVVEKKAGLKIRVEGHSQGFKAGVFTVPAKVVYLSAGCDAAILTIPPVPWEFRGASIERRLPHVGNEVMAVGNMRGVNFDGSVSEGIVAQIGVHPPEFSGFPWDIVDQSTAINLPGSSGGPVFSKATGKLLGIQVGNVEGAVFLYLPSRVLLAFSHAEGWGWLFGDGRITEKQIGELMAKVPAPPATEPPNVLQQLLSIPELQVVPVPESPAKKPRDLHPGHR